MTKGKPLDLEKKIIIEPLDAYMHGVKFTPEQQEVVFKIVDDTEKEIKQRIRKAVQGLEEGIKRCIEWAECQTDLSREDMLEQLREDIETEIKKWFPDEVKENE